MKLNKKAFEPLDDYEKQLIKDLENDEFVTVPNQKEEMKRYRNYFQAMPKKNKRISIRITEQDLKEIQKKAIKTGIPYQTIVTSVLHLYAQGKVEVSL